MGWERDHQAPRPLLPLALVTCNGQPGGEMTTLSEQGQRHVTEVSAMIESCSEWAHPDRYRGNITWLKRLQRASLNLLNSSLGNSGDKLVGCRPGWSAASRPSRRPAEPRTIQIYGGRTWTPDTTPDALLDKTPASTGQCTKLARRQLKKGIDKRWPRLKEGRISYLTTLKLRVQQSLTKAKRVR